MMYLFVVFVHFVVPNLGIAVHIVLQRGDGPRRMAREGRTQGSPVQGRLGHVSTTRWLAMRS